MSLYPVAFVCNANPAIRVDLRGPSGLSGTVRLIQPEEYSTGWKRFGYSPRAIIHTLIFDYQRMSQNEKDLLDNYYDTVDLGLSQTYQDVDAGYNFTVWFDKPEMSFSQTSYEVYSVQIPVWGTQSFHPAPASPAAISALLNAAHYPDQVTRTQKRPRVLMSDGSQVVYSKSSITRRTTDLNLVRMSRDNLGSLITHFLSVGGPRDLWSWGSQTCRYAEHVLSWQRSSVNTGYYDVQVKIEEDL